VAEQGLIALGRAISRVGNTSVTHCGKAAGTEKSEKDENRRTIQKKGDGDPDGKKNLVQDPWGNQKSRRATGQSKDSYQEQEISGVIGDEIKGKTSARASKKKKSSRHQPHYTGEERETGVRTPTRQRKKLI